MYVERFLFVLDYEPPGDTQMRGIPFKVVYSLLPPENWVPVFRFLVCSKAIASTVSC